MFCPKCGAQLPDGTQFCSECGASTESEDQGAAQSVPQPTQPFGAPAQQPTYPQQFGDQQPGYAAPVYGQTAVKKKVPVVPIIIGVCSAAIVAFLIVLFTVIIPKNSGIEGKLRHKWSATENGITATYDLKNNQVSISGLSLPITWEVIGEDHLKIEMSFLGQSDTQEFIFSLSSDGKTLTLAEVKNPSVKTDFKRSD